MTTTPEAPMESTAPKLAKLRPGLVVRPKSSIGNDGGGIITHVHSSDVAYLNFYGSTTTDAIDDLEIPEEGSALDKLADMIATIIPPVVTTIPTKLETVEYETMRTLLNDALGSEEDTIPAILTYAACMRDAERDHGLLRKEYTDLLNSGMMDARTIARLLAEALDADASRPLVDLIAQVKPLKESDDEGQQINASLHNDLQAIAQALRLPITQWHDRQAIVAAVEKLVGPAETVPTLDHATA